MQPFSQQFELFVFFLAAVIAGFTLLSVKTWRHFNGPRFRPQWIILYACVLQGIWGFSLFFFGKSDIAAWASLKFIPTSLLSGLFITSSALAFFGLLKDRSIFWMLPQQGMMMIAAIGCITMVILGHYADGPVYPRIFILRDQLPEILTAIFHTCAIFHRERFRLWKIINSQLSNYCANCGLSNG